MKITIFAFLSLALSTVFLGGQGEQPIAFHQDCESLPAQDVLFASLIPSLGGIVEDGVVTAPYLVQSISSQNIGFSDSELILNEIQIPLNMLAGSAILRFSLRPNSLDGQSEIELATTFWGSLELLEGPDEIEAVLDNSSSFANLQILREDNIQISGLFLLDRSLEENAGSLPRDNWYFIEPLRKLVGRLSDRFQTMYPNVCSGDFEALLSDLDSNGVHVVYEVRETKFAIDLAPWPRERINGDMAADYLGTLQYSHADTASQGPTNLCSDPATFCPDVQLQVRFDDQFDELAADGGTTPEDDIVAVMNTALAPQTSASPTGSSVSISTFLLDSGVEVDFKFNPIDISQWNQTLILSTEPNAYQLMCDLIDGTQGFSQNQGSQVFNLIHLFAGSNLAVINDSEAIDDSGDGFCPSGGCGTAGKNIVGLAQSIGGFKESSTGGHCTSAAPYTMIDSFDPAGPRSLSQHHPIDNENDEITLASCRIDAPADDDTNCTVYFDGILLQRWALVTHEIAHTLGMIHSEIDTNSFMGSRITNEITYVVATDAKVSINECLETADPTASGNC